MRAEVSAFVTAATQVRIWANSSGLNVIAIFKTKKYCVVVPVLTINIFRLWSFVHLSCEEQCHTETRPLAYCQCYRSNNGNASSLKQEHFLHLQAYKSAQGLLHFHSCRTNKCLSPCLSARLRIMLLQPLSFQSSSTPVSTLLACHQSITLGTLSFSTIE